MAKLNLDMILNMKDKATAGLKKFNSQLDKTNKKLKEAGKASSQIGARPGAGGAGRGGGAGLATAGILGGAASISALTALSTVLRNIQKNTTILATGFKHINAAVSEGLSPMAAWSNQAGRVAIEISKAEKAATRWITKQRQVASATKKTTQETKNSIPIWKRLTNSVKGSYKGFFSLGGLLATGTIALGLKSIISAGAEFESLRAKLAGVTTGTQEAEKAFLLIKDTASKLPTTVQETTEAFIRMQALGIVPTQERMLAFGNVAAAMGKSIIQFTEAAADAAVGEFERLKEFGIKARSEGDKVTFTFKGAAVTVGKNASEIVDYLQEIGVSQFGDAAALQMETLNGKTSNLKDAFAELKDSLARGGLNDAVKSLVTGLTNLVRWFNSNYNSVRRFGVAMVSVMGRGVIEAKFAARLIGSYFQVMWHNQSEALRVFAENIVRQYKIVVNKLDEYNPFSDESKVYDVPEKAIASYKNLFTELKKVATTRKEEIKTHEAALDLWNMDIPLTEEGTAVAKAYNEELKKRDVAMRKQAAAIAAANKPLEGFAKYWKELVGDSDAYFKNIEYAWQAQERLDEMFQAGKINSEQYLYILDQINDQLGVISEETEETTNEVTVFWQEAARNMQDAMGNTFFDWMEGKAVDLVGTFRTMINRMVAELLASKLLTFLLGDFSETGSLGGFVGSLFRADGGPVDANQPYIVGERGPELFVPESSGDIVPNGAGMGSNINLTVNAIDSQGMLQAVESIKRPLAEMVNGTNATYNMRTV